MWDILGFKLTVYMTLIKCYNVEVSYGSLKNWQRKNGAISICYIERENTEKRV